MDGKDGYVNYPRVMDAMPRGVSARRQAEFGVLPRKKDGSTSRIESVNYPHVMGIVPSGVPAQH